MRLAVLSGLAFHATIASAPADAQAMRADVFLQKAEALKAKGPLALLSGDMGLLKQEMRASAEQLRAERLAAVRAGQQPAYCPTDKSALEVGEIIAHFRSIPESERSRTSTKQAFKQLMIKKYPCRS
jgi:hypothetical protein